MSKAPRMEVHARIMLPEGVAVGNVDRSLWRATPDEFRVAVPHAKSVSAFTSVLHDPADGIIYCGLTDRDNELLWAYDPGSGRFTQRHFKQVADKYDVKIHRSLVLDPDDGMLYTASACLHDQPEYLNAGGGKLFRHFPAADQTEVLAVPVPHEYIQTICMDTKRKIIYGHCYPTPHMFAYHIVENRTVPLGLGALPHRAGCDRDGNLWGTIGHRGHLFRYNPEDGMAVSDQIPMPEFNRQRLSMNIFYQAPDENTCYIGTGAGALLAFDPQNVAFRYIGKPLLDVRIEGLQVGSDGILYGCGGYYDSEIFAYDREADRLINLGPIADPQLDIRCIIPHDMTMTDDDVIYTGETDMTGRSTAALWECKVTW